MKFIIPQNYKFKNKIFGVLDYPTAIINLIWCLFLYLILRNISISIPLKICTFSTLSFPILLLSIVGFNNESPLYSLRYIIYFYKTQKIYLYKKHNPINSKLAPKLQSSPTLHSTINENQRILKNERAKTPIFQLSKSKNY